MITLRSLAHHLRVNLVARCLGCYGLVPVSQLLVNKTHQPGAVDGTLNTTHRLPQNLSGYHLLVAVAGTEAGRKAGHMACEHVLCFSVVECMVATVVTVRWNTQAAHLCVCLLQAAD